MSSSSAPPVTDLDSFWQFLFATFEQLFRHHNTDDLGLAERLVMRVDDCIAVLQAVLSDGMFEEPADTQTIHDLQGLISELQGHQEHYAGWILQIEPSGWWGYTTDMSSAINNWPRETCISNH